MPFKVMHAHGGLAQCGSQRTGNACAHQQCARQAGAARKGHHIHIRQGFVRVFHDLPTQGQRTPNVVATGQLRHHAAISLVHVNLTVQRMRQQLGYAGARRIHQRHTRFITTRFKSQYKHAASVGDPLPNSWRSVIRRTRRSYAKDPKVQATADLQSAEKPLNRCHFMADQGVLARILQHFKMTSPQSLRLVVVAPDLSTAEVTDEAALLLIERSRQLRIGLLEGGFNLIATLPADTFLRERLAQLQPDMIIVDAESEARDSLEHVVMATRDERRPVVLFTNDNDTSHVKYAVAAGVSAYIVAGLEPARIRPILDVAMARFEHEQGLRRELLEAKTELHDRKVIDRAKGMLMARQNLSEKVAYERLRKAAMDKGLRIGEVAQRMLDAADLLG